MTQDFEQLGQALDVEADVCVIGGGVAGLMICERLINKSDLKIVLLEAGGMDVEDECQELYQLEVRGLPYTGHLAGRFRAMGGSSTRWGGGLLPLHPEDIAPRDFVPLSGWPIKMTELEPYYSEGHRAIRASGLPFDESFAGLVDGAVPQVNKDNFRIRFSKGAPYRSRNVANTLGPAIFNSSRLQAYYHATVSSIELSQDENTVDHIQVVGRGGVKGRVRAKTTILCCGGIETARVLLYSNSVQKEGVGNQNDVVGRFYQDHFGVRAAKVTPKDRSAFCRLFEPYFSDGTQHRIRLELSGAAQQRLQVLSAMCHVSFEADENSGFAALRQLVRAKQSGHKLEKNITPAQLLSSVSDALRLAWGAKVRKRLTSPKSAEIYLHIVTEQAPNPDSRIGLTNELDHLGLPKAYIDWKATPLEGKTVRATAELVEAEFKRLSLGSLDWMPGVMEPGDGWLKHNGDVYHHIGSTRMGTDPLTSVVDPDLKVHGIDNLYIASSSVFPTGASSHPTLAIMALSLRLVDHLLAKK